MRYSSSIQPYLLSCVITPCIKWLTDNSIGAKSWVLFFWKTTIKNELHNISDFFCRWHFETLQWLSLPKCHYGRRGATDSHLLASPLQNSHYMKTSCRIYILNLVCKAVWTSHPRFRNQSTQDPSSGWDARWFGFKKLSFHVGSLRTARWLHITRVFQHGGICICRCAPFTRV